MKVLLFNATTQSTHPESLDCQIALSHALTKIGIDAPCAHDNMHFIEDFDLVHVFNLNTKSCFNQMAIARAAAKPIVVTPFFFRDRHEAPVWSQKEVVDYASAIICSSQHEAREIMKYYGSELSPKIHIAPWGVDDRYCYDGDAAEYDRPYIVSQGTMHRDGGQMELVNAVSRLGYRMIFVGTWSDPFYRSALAAQPLVIIYPQLPAEDMARLYRGAVAVCFTDFFNPYGTVVIEAAACGCEPKLVVNKDIWSAEWLPSDVQASIMSPHAFCQAVQQAIKRPRDEKRGELCRSEFDWDKIVTLYKDIYEAVL